MRVQPLFAVVAIAAALALIGNDAWRERGDGLSLDILHWLSGFVPATAAPANDNRTVIIGIDEETYARDPFRLTPQAMWTPQIGAVLDAVLDGGADVVGIDAIFNKSVAAAPAATPEADAVLRNYDRNLLRALNRGGKEKRIVMSYNRQGGQPLWPYRSQALAVGGSVNLRPTNMIDDDDGVIRSALLKTHECPGTTACMPEEERDIAGFALEVFSRATHQDLTFDASGAPLIGGKRLPETGNDRFLLNFKPVAADPPLYSFADLYACVQAGNADFFRQHFAGRTVIFGAVLDTEDRRLTAKRLATNPMGQNYAARCVYKDVIQSVLSPHVSKFIPGSYILATAIDNLKQGNWLRSASEGLRLACLFLLAFVMAGLVTYRPFLQATIGVGIIGIAWMATAAFVFAGNLVLPLIAGIGVMLAALPASLTYRIALVDRLRRQLRRSFALYLPEAELERLTAEGQAPSLGGELREVTILFSDIAGYSKLSESLSPGDLVRDLNAYFGRMTEIVQKHGGFVDKFIGDGILAVFGAPVRNGNHALAGTQAALDMVAACAGDANLTLNGERFHIRVGLHTGEAIVGNIGSPNRFNYTVVGDSVNLASRLEGVGKRYHTSIILSEQTRELVGDAIACRELDQVRVVGRDQPVRLFTPLADSGDGWMIALSQWRTGDFAAAAAGFRTLAEAGDEIAGSFAERAAAYSVTPPASWDGIVNLSEK
ncbi:adenylate/guanylate cyclase domain-containing protein [Dongia soli]|uniref:Adenylate/guanylate cyclase domain-containing protein n=1 Tax=Dongia soli TaxID=600628 RepID=A0ABU5EG09_9PROT|nr:adenylate/guanylate cyclase domain-containing protein [Dongia soli]MDY0884450.1 adenylate/guanylate cyclase domain-containing protein [Dongia soli]